MAFQDRGAGGRRMRIHKQYNRDKRQDNFTNKLRKKMRLFIIISEQEGLRTVRANFHDMELSKTKIPDSARVLFQFISDDTPRQVYIKLTDVHLLTPEELSEIKEQKGHVYARVKSLEPILNPPKFLDYFELRHMFTIYTRRDRLELMMEILARAEELNEKRIIEITKNAMKVEDIPDNIAAILIKFYEDKIQY